MQDHHPIRQAAVVLFALLVAFTNDAPRDSAAATLGEIDQVIDHGSAHTASGPSRGSVGIVPARSTRGSPSGAKALQYRSGQHVMAFQPRQVVMASADHALRVEFADASGVMPVGSGQTGEGATAPWLGRVTYEGLWEGVDLVYETSAGGIAKSTYRLAAEAEIASIRLRYNVPVELKQDGSLELRFRRGVVRESAPVAWQEVGGRRVPVAVAFVVCEDGLVGFSSGDYDCERALFIDPMYSWHTFYGSSTVDIPFAIAVDGGGSVYVTGDSSASWTGPAPANPAPLHGFSGRQDIVVLKLDSNGEYLWHTFYGSSNIDEGLGIAVDGGGSVYVTGFSYAGWTGPAPANPAPLHGHSGLFDIVVLKLDSDGAYQWHTFYGTAFSEGGMGIAVDVGGNVYVTGSSEASWTGPAPGNASPLHGHSGASDSVVLKLGSDGEYQWHMFFGSSSDDVGRAIATDGSGNVLVTGESTASWTGPAPANPAPLHGHSGGLRDITVLKLDSDGAYQWHTFYGPSVTDAGNRIALDGSGNVCVTFGSDASWTGPAPANAAPLHDHSGGSLDIGVLKLDSDGAYQWHTFYGSSTLDFPFAIAVDGGGDVFVTGDSGASWTGPAPANTAPLHGHSGGGDITVLALDSEGAYKWHTFHGTSIADSAYGIAVDGSGDVYVTGPSPASWIGPAPASAAPLHGYSGQSEILVLKLAQLSAAPVEEIPALHPAGLAGLALLLAALALILLRPRQ